MVATNLGDGCDDTPACTQVLDSFGRTSVLSWRHREFDVRNAMSRGDWPGTHFGMIIGEEHFSEESLLLIDDLRLDVCLRDSLPARAWLAGGPAASALSSALQERIRLEPR